jgi:PAS domain S-box-containing protein
VEQRFYNLMLIRLLGLPVVALVLLAVTLGFGLRRVEQSARTMDHSDRIIAQTNLISKQISDEETGLRGFLLTHNPIFLQPLRDAHADLYINFEILTRLVRRRPDQVQRVNHLQLLHRQWEVEAVREINDPSEATASESHMLARKQAMDSIRADFAEFLQIEQTLREQRASKLIQTDYRSELGLVAAALLIAVFIAWGTWRSFVEVAAVHRDQVEEIRITSRMSYEREQWLNTTLRSIGDAVIACDMDGCVSLMNPVAEHLTGWREAEAEGKSLHEVFPIFNENTRAPVENPVDKVRRLGTIVGLANHTFLLSREGKEICIDDSGAPIRSATGEMIGVVMAFRDITSKKLSDEALMRAEKLAAAGRLAASVAHEVNNPLEGLTNLIYIARRTDQVEEIRRLLMMAEQELGRIAHITRQSLGFYREITSATHYNPSDVVREVCDFYRTRSIAVRMILTIDTKVETEILGISGEIRQVLSNLLANSLDAGSAGSRIRVSVRSASDPRNPSISGVRISISDGGSGIDPAHLQEIFEPFFTTKKDTGTGLGLWVSRQLVEKNGGKLRVRSRIGGRHGGTTFSMFLPKAGIILESDATTGEIEL